MLRVFCILAGAVAMPEIIAAYGWWPVITIAIATVTFAAGWRIGCGYWPGAEPWRDSDDWLR